MMAKLKHLLMLKTDVLLNIVVKNMKPFFRVLLETERSKEQNYVFTATFN